MKEKPITIQKAGIKDAEEILKLQKLAFYEEAKLYNDFSIPPLTQTLPEILDDLKNYIVLEAITGEVIVGSVRGQINEEGACYIARLIVHPDFQKRGIGTRLLLAIEEEFPQAAKYTLGTGHLSVDNIRLYEKNGYTKTYQEQQTEAVIFIHMDKPNPRLKA